MKAIIFFTGTGPILVLTSFGSVNDPGFIEKLYMKGIQKFIAYEVPLNLVREKYGSHFKAILNDVKQTDDIRVLDYNGHNVFYNFSFAEMGNPIHYEP